MLDRVLANLQVRAMTIREYLDRKQLSVEELADQIGVHYSTVYRWLKGGEIKSGDMQRLIEVSHNAIKATDILRTNGDPKRAA